MKAGTDDQAVAELGTAVLDAAIHAPDVSQWSVGMHVHHCALGMIRICNGLLESDPPPPRSRFSAPRTLVFATGRIPRGRGKSPEAALPDPDVSREDLRALLDQSEQLIGQVRWAEPDQWWKHFAFGIMDRDQTLRFIGIHNRHHLRIISDIQAAAE